MTLVVMRLDLDFIDDEINFQDQEPTDCCLMNITRDLQDAIAGRSMAFDFDLVAVASLMSNLKFSRKNQKIPFTFLYPTPSTIIYSRKRKILIFAKTRKDCTKF